MGLLDKGYIWRSMSLCVVLAFPAQKKKSGLWHIYVDS